MKYENRLDKMHKDVWYWGMVFGIGGYVGAVHYEMDCATLFSAVLLTLMINFTADRLANDK